MYFSKRIKMRIHISLMVQKKMIVYSLLFLLLSLSATLRRDKSILYSRETILVILYCFIIILNNLNYIERGIGLYGGLFHATSITQVIDLFIYFLSVLILGLTAFYPRKISIKQMATFIDLLINKLNYNNTEIINKMGQRFKILEYPLILLFIITGSIFLISTSDLVSLFISIELQSYGLYLLCTLYRNSELSTSAGLTYFLLGGLSSCFILLATSLLYATSGITNLDAFYVITSLSNITNDNNNNISSLSKSFEINISLVIMSVGFLFKIAAAPFHF